MKTEEKFKAILERLKESGEGFTPTHLSFIMINAYLSAIEDTGAIKSPVAVTPQGQRAMAICEEFDWKPTDNDVDAYVNEVVGSDPVLKPVVKHMILEYRDNRKEFLEEIKKLKSEENG